MVKEIVVSDKTYKMLEDAIDLAYGETSIGRSMDDLISLLVENYLNDPF